jgi:hypothetical protein
MRGESLFFKVMPVRSALKSGMKQTKALSIDTILLLILDTAYVVGFHEAIGAFLVLTVASYALLDTSTCSNALNISLERLFGLKLSLVMLAIFLVVVLSTISWLMGQATTPWQCIHDRAIRVEESVKYLLQGKNPYVEDYLETPMAQWEYAVEGVEENPALYHSPYLLFIFVLSTPVYIVVKYLTHWYDQRLIYLCLFLSTLGTLAKHAREPSRKLNLLIFFGSNFLASPSLLRDGTTAL